MASRTEGSELRKPIHGGTAPGSCRKRSSWSTLSACCCGGAIFGSLALRVGGDSGDGVAELWPHPIPVHCRCAQRPHRCTDHTVAPTRPAPRSRERALLHCATDSCCAESEVKAHLLFLGEVRRERKWRDPAQIVLKVGFILSWQCTSEATTSTTNVDTLPIDLGIGASGQISDYSFNSQGAMACAPSSMHPARRYQRVVLILDHAAP